MTTTKDMMTEYTRLIKFISLAQNQVHETIALIELAEQEAIDLADKIGIRFYDKPGKQGG